MTHPVIALVSDFGARDGYAGAMKGVLAREAPDARVVDVTHEVPPGDLLHAAWVIATVWRDFPDGTIFLGVVDPGVGSERRGVALESAGRFGVGPDNGLFTFVAEGARAVTLPARVEASPVFHGRDVFAPAASALANGARLEALGAPAGPLVSLPLTRPVRRADGTIEGHVIHVDRFGNCVTDVTAVLLGDGPVHISVGGRDARLARYYAEARAGELVGLVNSAGHLELAVRDGPASETFGIGRGDVVLVRPR